MRIITNNDLLVQPLSYMERELFYFLRSFKFPTVYIPLTNMANRFKRSTRTIKRILKSLVEKGFISRTKRGWGHTSFTAITEIGERFAKSRMKKNVPSDVPSERGVYLRCKSLKRSKIPLSPLPTNVVENKVVELPKLLGEGFVKTAQKVLSKINCALQVKVAKEFDSFAAKQVVRNPIAFLRHKINQLVALEANTPVLPNRIVTEQLKTEIKAKALDLAKDELKRNGKGYPVFSPGMSTAQHFDDVQAYGIREAELYRFYERKLEDEMKVTKSNC